MVVVAMMVVEHAVVELLYPVGVMEEVSEGPVRRPPVLDRGEVPVGPVPGRVEFTVSIGEPVDPSPVSTGTPYAPEELLNIGIDELETAVP